MSVEFKGKEYSVKKKGRGESSRISLNLSGKGIIDISEIKGLDNLVNLEELSLEYNKIEIIKGLDTLKNLHALNLFGNEITQIESFQNEEKLTRFMFSGNPLYRQVKEIFGVSNAQNLIEFNQMSVSEMSS